MITRRRPIKIRLTARQRHASGLALGAVVQVTPRGCEPTRCLVARAKRHDMRIHTDDRCVILSVPGIGMADHHHVIALSETQLLPLATDATPDSPEDSR